MKQRSIPFEKLPFNSLFSSYVRGDEPVKPLFPEAPFDDSAVKERASTFRFPGDRNRTADALERFNRYFEPPEGTLRQIEALREPDSLVVVTGQQLSLYGGPLFTIYKTLTTIIYARRWQELLGRPVVPVFWLADEDHDFPEAAGAGLLNEDRWRYLEMENAYPNRPVGRVPLDGSFTDFERELFDLLPDSDFAGDLKATLRMFYREGATFRDAFGRWMLHLFADKGLILAGSDDQEIKQLVARPMQVAATDYKGLYQALESQSVELEGMGYERQALVQNSNLFYLDQKKGRQKLDVVDGRWTTGNGRSWDSESIGSDIVKHPWDYSPNVFLRPMIQDRLLPTLAYVCGPGELAYYGQMKRAYEWMGQEMPLLLPRFSVTLVEPAIARISGELPLEFSEYPRRIEDLESLYLKRQELYDIESIFDDWAEQVESITRVKRDEVGKIDPTLISSADKAGTLFVNELNKLKGKTYRSVKKQEAIQIRRLRRVRENLFPGGALQERQISFIYYMFKYGPEVWDRLMDTLVDEVPDSHKVVSL